MQKPLSYSIPVTKFMIIFMLTEHNHSLERCDGESDVALGIVEASNL
jgi:hypothetical protein